jgi:hypothetical protein
MPHGLVAFIARSQLWECVWKSKEKNIIHTCSAPKHEGKPSINTILTSLEKKNTSPSCGNIGGALLPTMLISQFHTFLTVPVHKLSIVHV